METIDINEVFAQANVVENLKNFAGIDAQNALGMMSQERLAAVVGGKIWEKNNAGTPAHIDFGKKIEAGFYSINDLSRDTINPPIPGHFSCILISSGTHDLLVAVDGQRILGRFTGGGHLEWINIL